MANKNTKFKDLKKGDHLYWVSIKDKTYEPIFEEYQLVDDMVFTGPKGYQYECHIIPINEQAEKGYWCGPKWDGKPVRWWPGWKWDRTGEGSQMTTCLEYAAEYYKWLLHNGGPTSKLDEDINKLQKKLERLKKLRKYHKEQCKNFDFYRKFE